MNTANLLEISNTTEEVEEKFNSMIDHIIINLTDQVLCFKQQKDELMTVDLDDSTFSMIEDIENHIDGLLDIASDVMNLREYVSIATLYPQLLLTMGDFSEANPADWEEYDSYAYAQCNFDKSDESYREPTAILDWLKNDDADRLVSLDKVKQQLTR